MNTILESERLLLRPPRPSDAPHFIELHADPEVMQYIGLEATQNEEEARAYLANVIEKMSKGDDLYYYWVGERKDNGAFIGWYTLRRLEGTADIELGYRLKKAAWGKGFGTEGSHAVLEYAFNGLKLAEVMALTMHDNKASSRIMEKLGMTFQRNTHFYGVDCAYYAIEKASFC